MTATDDRAARLADAIRIHTAGMEPEQRALVLERVRQHQTRKASLRRLDGPLGLLLALNPTWSASPALQLISDEMEHAITTPGSWLLISMPPQEGKSRLARHALVRALQHNPDCRAAVASYQERLARKIGEAARNIVQTRGSDAGPEHDLLGIAVERGSATKSDWTIRGHEGGVLSVGVGSGITGNAVDLLVVDDPLKGRQQADSETIRDALHDWWDNDAETRLGPGSSVIIIQTRWHEDDLIGRLTTDPDQDDDLDEVPAEPVHDRTLRVVNIPARADGETLDSLADTPGGRDPDGWLVSVRGDRTPKWARLEKTRPRVWSALYQGRPAPLAGGIFQQQWMDQHRVHTAPDLVRVEIGVDPADTGSSDAAGILVAGRAADGHMYVLADLSGQLSRAAWARRVCLAAVRWEAACIVSERTLGMQTAIRDAWSVLRRQAAALRAATGAVPTALAALLAAGDEVAADEAELRELAPVAEQVLTLPSSAPCRVDVVTPKQAKQVRAEAITVYYEVGRVHHVGRLAQLEHEQTTWQEGQDSPNRLDTLAHLLPHLDGHTADARVSRPTRRVPTRTHGGPGVPTGPTRR